MFVYVVFLCHANGLMHCLHTGWRHDSHYCFHLIPNYIYISLLCETYVNTDVMFLIIKWRLYPYRTENNSCRWGRNSRWNLEKNIARYIAPIANLLFYEIMPNNLYLRFDDDNKMEFKHYYNHQKRTGEAENTQPHVNLSNILYFRCFQISLHNSVMCKHKL